MFSMQFYCGQVLQSTEGVFCPAGTLANWPSLVEAEAQLRGANSETLHEAGQTILDCRTS